MFLKSKIKIFLNFFFWMMMRMIIEVAGAQNCLVLQSTNFYGGQRSTFDQNLCFEVQVADLKEIIVHTNSNLVGFTFNFKDGTTRNFTETSGSTNDFLIDLSTSDLIGCTIYVVEGIEGLEFQLYDWNKNEESFSAVMGQSGDCFSYFNSSSLNIEYLKIDSIQGCIDNKESNYFPFLSFSYSFSQCPFKSSITSLTTDLISGLSPVLTSEISISIFLNLYLSNFIFFNFS
jgi:hypothetical protein